VRSVARLIVPTVLCLGLAACAACGWYKDGASAQALERDLRDCQVLANELAARPNPSDASAPPVALDRRFGAQVEGPIRPTEARLRGQQLVNSCMRDKGYGFEPAAR
jgi:hypothetical protein